MHHDQGWRFVSVHRLGVHGYSVHTAALGPVVVI